MRIPDEKVQEVRDAVSIVDVVSQYVSLKQRGKSHVGLCPFHSEKTPSFTVDPVRGYYHCFGCDAGGDVFSFVMKMEKVGFLEAVKTLADKSGIALPSTDAEDGRDRENELLYRANALAMEFFRAALSDPAEGNAARQYLVQRGFPKTVTDAFQIGLSPKRWDGLIRRAGQAGIGADALVRAGLAVPRKDGGGHYDRFRGRLMFPVFNVSGRVVGFGGRVLETAENTPKYINTSETPVYQKSLILFGLFQAKSGIRREGRVLIVEGYTDLMRLHQAGLDHAVASSGTALTEGQVKLLSQYTRHAVLVFDGDSAGLRAALRGIDVVLAGGLHVDVAVLPRGVDPDLLILKQGPEAMRECLKNAVSFVDFQLAKIRSESKLASGHDRVSAARRLLATVSRIQDPMERQVVLKEIAEKLDIEEPLLARELKKSLPAEESPGQAPQTEVRATGRREKAERGLLAFLLSGGAAWADLVFQIVEPEHILSPVNRKMFLELDDIRSRGGSADPETLFDRFRRDSESSSALSRLLADDLLRGADLGQFGLDCVLILVDSLHQDRIGSIRKGLKTSPSAEAENVVQEWLKAKKTLENLKLEIISAWKKIVEF